jgi:GTP pyrophosphokinase
MKYLKKFEKIKQEQININNYKLIEFISKVKSAAEFAEKAHAGVKRKSGGPYFKHPEAVAKIVHDVKNSKMIAYLVAVAYLHDVVEDTDITIEEIRKIFGDLIANLVDELISDVNKIALIGKENYLIDKMLNMTSWA